MQSKTYVYAGNRSTVLEKMIELNLNVSQIIATKGSHLEKELIKYKIPSTIVESKLAAIELIKTLNFDYFISVGFKHILPIDAFQKLNPKNLFINIHPSFLPDLRGADPIPGAVLFARDSGVTCHRMDNGIDTGPIIAQRKIPYQPSFNSEQLYRETFQLESIIFEEAYDKNFLPLVTSFGRANPRDPIYYSFKEGDNHLSVSDSYEDLLRKINAFNTKSKGLIFSIENSIYKAFHLSIKKTYAPKNLLPSTNYQIIETGLDYLQFILNSEIVTLSNIIPPPEGRIKKGFFILPPSTALYL